MSPNSVHRHDCLSDATVESRIVLAERKQDEENPPVKRNLSELDRSTFNSWYELDICRTVSLLKTPFISENEIQFPATRCRAEQLELSDCKTLSNQVKFQLQNWILSLSA